jgi:hypothetical protein
MDPREGGMRGLRWYCLGLALVTCGCGVRGLAPPTPAANLSPLDFLAAPPPANERYYVLLFGSQTKPRIPRHTHTWATMVKVTQAEGAEPSLETQTISWLPDSGRVRVWKIHVEPGSNLELHETIKKMLHTGQRVSLWGPYETWHGLYARYTTQKAFLDSDAIGYQCVDGIGEAARKANGCNCFHALSDMDPQFDRRLYPLRYFGDDATLNIVGQIHERPILIRPGQTHDWLIEALGLDCYPIVRRHYEGPSQEFSPEAVMQAWQQRGGSPCR